MKKSAVYYPALVTKQINIYEFRLWLLFLEFQITRELYSFLFFFLHATLKEA